MYIKGNYKKVEQKLQSTIVVFKKVFALKLTSPHQNEVCVSHYVGDC